MRCYVVVVDGIRLSIGYDGTSSNHVNASYNVLNTKLCSCQSVPQPQPHTTTYGKHNLDKISLFRSRNGLTWEWEQAKLYENVWRPAGCHWSFLFHIRKLNIRCICYQQKPQRMNQFFPSVQLICDNSFPRRCASERQTTCRLFLNFLLLLSSHLLVAEATHTRWNGIHSDYGWKVLSRQRANVLKR